MGLDSFGKRLTEVRKGKKISQDELGKTIKVVGAVIGRYERGEVKPSIDTAAAIAQALEVSLDYLVGNSDLILDRDIIKRISDIQRLDTHEQEHVNALLDAFLRDTKAKKAYSK